MKVITSLVMLCCLLSLSCSMSGQWIPLFDGESLDGWQASEHTDSWKIEDGALVTAGERSHLFYQGDVLKANFRNFEFSADVKTTPGANSGIYIHTCFLITPKVLVGFPGPLNSSWSQPIGARPLLMLYPTSMKTQQRAL